MPLGRLWVLTTRPLPSPCLASARRTWLGTLPVRERTLLLERLSNERELLSEGSEKRVPSLREPPKELLPLDDEEKEEEDLTEEELGLELLRL